jgi:serine/threonine protein kinase/tetratricopeptide (TPR) repeat protein
VTNRLIAPLDGLDDFVRAFEHAWHGRQPPELRDFLPVTSHPLFLSVLRELVRVDLELRWERKCPRPLDDYRRLYSELFREEGALSEVAFEEYRLRLQEGDQPSPEEYAKQFGIDTADWPRTNPSPSGAVAPESVQSATRLPVSEPIEAQNCDEATHVYCRFLAAGHDKPIRWQDGEGPSGAAAEHSKVLRELSAVDWPGARRLAEAMTHFPAPGGEMCGFRLLSELGRGAFARVYLAQQGELAGRLVAVKFSADIFCEESQTLAQLQHTNIVPIYSLHRAPPFVVVCMPYFGAATLADVIRHLHSCKELPASGRGLATTLENSSRLAVSTLKESRPNNAAPVLEFPAAAPAAPHHPSPKWEELSYVEAVLWLAARMTEGLEHAHDRGILHRDLKPANVLLTDEGQPMLLDFNLAIKVCPADSPATAQIGGTLPYMAPECLQGLLLHKRAGDARSDLYSLGIILYELLTGRRPFLVRTEHGRDSVPLLLQDRSSLQGTPRKWNRAVSPAVSAIVLKCLHPQPALRYQSASQLREDIERQLHHKPLRFAPDRSIRERAAKWRKRHPRLTSSTTVAALAALALAVLLGLMFVQYRRQTELEVQTDLRNLKQAMESIPFLLARPVAEPAQLAEGIALCQKHADKFGVLADSDWQQSPRVQLLDEAERAELRQAMGELLWFWARALTWNVPTDTTAFAQHEQVTFALRLNQLAGLCYPTTKLPGTLLRQRAKLLELSGNHDAEAKRLYALAEASLPRNPREHYLVLCEQVGQADFHKVLPFLQQASLDGPANSALWLVLGNCHAELDEFSAAKACFDHGLALDPKSPWAWFNRGLLNLQHGDNTAAKGDFTKALDLRPNLVEALMNRAIAELKLNDPQTALDDLNSALEQKAPYTRIYFMRAEAKAARKDMAGAARDQEHGLQLTPTDELSWVVRGEQRLKLKKDATGAVADFDQALNLNPRSPSALENKAAVLAEFLNKTADAIKVLNQAVKFHPHVPLYWASRGVLLARLGKRTEAHADAAKALTLSNKPSLLYQVAGIYALTSQTHPEDRSLALPLLQKALSQDKSLLSLVAGDPELIPIQDDPDFQAIVKLAGKLQRP